jgi:hypothetical protein
MGHYDVPVTRRAVPAAAGAAALLAALAGCARTPIPATDPAPVVSVPSTTVGGSDPIVPPPAPTLAPTSATPSFDPSVAVSCNGRPAVDQVVAVLRAKGVLPSGDRVTARLGPLCAGTWQYTVLTVSGQDSLRAVTQGAPTTLALVTAGTDVCSSAIQNGAPSGILAAAHC